MSHSPASSSPRIVIGFVCCLSVVVTTARCEGAWTLWRYTTHPPTEREDWSAIATYAGGEAVCLEGMEEQRARDYRRAYVVRRERLEAYIPGVKVQETRSYSCLPEFVNPRESPRSDQP